MESSAQIYLVFGIVFLALGAAIPTFYWIAIFMFFLALCESD